MRQRMRGNWPALAIAGLALFVALGGSVYAATRGKIEGRAVKVKSLPGNRLKLRSVPGNRLKPRSIQAAELSPGALASARLKTPLTGADINELTLGQVPRATHADTADYATSAGDAQTALDAVNAIDAQNVNGHSAGCENGNHRLRRRLLAIVVHRRPRRNGAPSSNRVRQTRRHPARSSPASGLRPATWRRKSTPGTSGPATSRWSRVKMPMQS